MLDYSTDDDQVQLLSVANHEESDSDSTNSDGGHPDEPSPYVAHNLAGPTSASCRCSVASATRSKVGRTVSAASQAAAKSPIRLKTSYSNDCDLLSCNEDPPAVKSANVTIPDSIPVHHVKSNAKQAKPFNQEWTFTLYNVDGNGPTKQVKNLRINFIIHSFNS